MRRSNSDWASPLHMVQKSDGSWRPCRDFRRLNLITEDDCYPLPNMADTTSSLAGATIFSKLDLEKGYHQIPVNPADVKKTAIITPFGIFEFLRMPFGLKNAGMFSNASSTGFSAASLSPHLPRQLFGGQPG